METYGSVSYTHLHHIDVILLQCLNKIRRSTRAKPVRSNIPVLSLIHICVNYDSNQRTISDWKIKEG